MITEATVGWHTVSADPEYHYFDSLLCSQIDNKTLELFCPDDAFHPFAFASKVQSDDFPTEKEVLQMPDEERCKWIETKHVEMSDLVERNGFKLVR